jgi:hypothetical protein
MKVVARGSAAREHPSAFAKRMGQVHGECTVREVGPVTIVAIEAYYFRINSELMVVVGLCAPSADRCDVQIFVGGGREGMAGFTWGAEGSAGERAMNLIREVCHQLGLGFEVTDPQ